MIQRLRAGHALPCSNGPNRVDPQAPRRPPLARARSQCDATAWS